MQRANLAGVLARGVSDDMVESFKKKGGAGRPLYAKAMRKMRFWNPKLKIMRLVGGPGTATEAVRALCDRLLSVAPSKATFDELKNYVAPYGDDAFNPGSPETRALLKDCVHLILSLPEYQLN